MSDKRNLVIEVKVPGGPEGWKKLVNDEMRQAIERLKSSVEELGGKVFVTY